MGIYLTTFLTPTLLFLYFLNNLTLKFQKYSGISSNNVSRQYMPIFIEIGPRTFKISRFESNIPENESHKFTIFSNKWKEKIIQLVFC